MHPIARIVPFACLLAGCASGGSSQGSSPDYSTTAKDNYDRGLAEMKKENWQDAIKLFQYTRSKFGFSKWATLAELGIADCNFGREKFPEAVDGYRNFIKNHPQHPKVQDGYAEYRIGEAYYKEIPGQWFLVPPAYEKDQGPVRDALRELSSFIAEYSDSPYLEQATKMESDCVRRLAEHELYVANFYLRRDKYAAAIGRLEGLARGDFLPRVVAAEAGAGRDLARQVSAIQPEVLLMLGRTYLKMERSDLARIAFIRIVEAYPDDFHAGKAKLYLDYIRKRYGDGAAAPPDSTQKKSTPSLPEESPASSGS